LTTNQFNINSTNASFDSMFLAVQTKVRITLVFIGFTKSATWRFHYKKLESSPIITEEFTRKWEIHQRTPNVPFAKEISATDVIGNRGFQLAQTSKVLCK